MAGRAPQTPASKRAFEIRWYKVKTVSSPRSRRKVRRGAGHLAIEAKYTHNEIWIVGTAGRGATSVQRSGIRQHEPVVQRGQHDGDFFVHASGLHEHAGPWSIVGGDRHAGAANNAAAADTPAPDFGGRQGGAVTWRRASPRTSFTVSTGVEGSDSARSGGGQGRAGGGRGQAGGAPGANAGRRRARTRRRRTTMQRCRRWRSHRRTRSRYRSIHRGSTACKSPTSVTRRTAAVSSRAQARAPRRRRRSGRRPWRWCGRGCG